MLAELGFGVVIIDGRGTSHQSRYFQARGLRTLDTMSLDDHMAAIKELDRRHSYIVTTRVGIFRISFGGWGVFRALLEFPDFFTVAVAGSPPASYHNMYVGGWERLQGRPVYSDGSGVRPAPSETPRNWNVIDSRLHVSKLKGRLLIVLAELDENVPHGATLQFMDALRKADKDFDLIYLLGHDHRSGYDPHTNRRISDYFVRHLMGAVPPDWNRSSTRPR